MAYDPDNIFSKIIKGQIPCYKVFETEHALAFLDAFPSAKGHSLLIPKAAGFASVMDMPADVAANVLSELPRLARAVKAATGADGVTILQNNGPAAGQEVFHAHFHVIPRFSDDQLMQLPKSSSEMISPGECDPGFAWAMDQILLLRPQSLRPSPLCKLATALTLCPLRIPPCALQLQPRRCESPSGIHQKQFGLIQSSAQHYYKQLPQLYANGRVAKGGGCDVRPYMTSMNWMDVMVNLLLVGGDSARVRSADQSTHRRLQVQAREVLPAFQEKMRAVTVTERASQSDSDSDDDSKFEV